MCLEKQRILLPEKLFKYLAMNTPYLTGRARVRINVFLTASCTNQQYSETVHTTYIMTAWIQSKCPLDFLTLLLANVFFKRTKQKL